MAQVVTFNEKALKQALIPQCAGNEQVANTVGNILVKQLESYGVIKTVEVQPEAPKAPEAPKSEAPTSRKQADLINELLSTLGPAGRNAAKDGILILSL